MTAISMVDGISNSGDTSERTRIGSFTCPVNGRPEDVMRNLDRDVLLAWSEPDGVTTVGYGTGVALRADRRSLSSIKKRGKDVLGRVELEAADRSTVPDKAYPRFFGGVTFSDARSSTHWKPFGRVQFVLPELQFTFSDSSSWLTVTEKGGVDHMELRDKAERIRRRAGASGGTGGGRSGSQKLSRIGQEPADRAEWTKMVETALSAIQRGELQKVVLARRRELDIGESFSMDRLQDRLFETSDGFYRFLFRPRNRTAFVGRSPECIVQKDGTDLRTESVGGTVESGDNEIQQKQFAEKLVDDHKRQREHSLVVESIRNYLAPMVESVSEGERTVRVLSNVQHLCTPIFAELTEDRHVLDLVETLHPTSAVGGYPRERAMELIRQLEPFDRGWYGGPVGWFDRHGDGCFAVGIRSGLIRNRSVYLYAGAGIVEGSDPDREWEEVEWKFESATSLLTERLTPARSS